MNDVYIFVIGTAVFMLTVGASFVSLLASDHPDEQPETAGNSAANDLAGRHVVQSVRKQTA